LAGIYRCGSTGYRRGSTNQKRCSGPNDSAWAEDPEWQQFADVLIESGIEIQAAARARDLDTLMDVSNEKMYPPCGECHLQFLPGAQ